MASGHSIPTLTEVEARMRPGVLSQHGFLGPNESLLEVLARDAVALRDLGLTPGLIADRLDELISAAEAAPSRSAHIGHFTVEITVYTGFQLCPWTPDLHSGQCPMGGGVRHASTDWRVKNRRSGEIMRGSGLIVHLIRVHGFFEGLESKYRVDPERVARLLELVPTRSH